MYNCIFRPQQPAYTKEQQCKIMYHVRSNCMLSYLHHGNEGPDVGKFKSEFPSDFHHCLHYSYSSVYHLKFRFESSLVVFQNRASWAFEFFTEWLLMNEFRLRISIAVYSTFSASWTILIRASWRFCWWYWLI